MRNVFRQGPRPDLPEHPGAPRRTPWGILFGLASLAWILLRVARKPSRLAYPCQQAALANVSLLLGVPVAAWLGRLVLRGGRRPWSAAPWWRRSGSSWLSRASPTPARRSRPLTATPWRPPATTSPGSTSWTTPEALRPAPSGRGRAPHLPGRRGQPFYKSETIGPESGPNGIIAADDVVLVKINAQWNQRGGTNTDVLKGLIARILEHPDGFTGEVVVVENTQGVGSSTSPRTTPRTIRSRPRTS